MTPEEADKWYADLMAWIVKNHPHLEERWWEASPMKYSRYSDTNQKK